MPRLSPLFGIALACATTTHSIAIAAPGIWRCGNSYSDTPCAGARQVDTPAPPSAEDRRQRDEGTRRDQAAADRMQRERREFEAQPPRQAVVIGSATREASAATPSANTLKPDKKRKSARPKKSEDFVASYTDPTAKPAGKKKK